MIFDEYIGKMAEYVEDLAENGRNVKTFDVPVDVPALMRGLPVEVCLNASPGIILRSDTYLELGNPEAGSTAFFLFTDDISIVKDGRISLVGPDISESEGKSLPFGQVLIMGGKSLTTNDYETLQHMAFISDQIEGYMVRSFTQNVWSRISKTAAEKGFDFETLGRALMMIYKKADLRIESMEIIFVTSEKNDILKLGTFEQQIRKLSKEIIRDNWKIKGVDIDCSLDCSACSDKPVCDEIRNALNKANESSRN